MSFSRILISSENVSSVNFVLYIVQAFVVAVGNDGLAQLLKLFEIIDHQTAKECGSVLERRFVDNDLCALCLDAFHHTLNAALAEIVAIALHCQAIDSDGAGFLFLCTIIILVGIVIITSLVEHTVGNEILSGSVTFHDGLNQVLRNVSIVGEQLLGVFREAITSVSERRIIIESSDAWIESYTIDNGFGVESFHFCISVQFVEIAYTQGEVGVGKSFTASASVSPINRVSIFSLMAPSCNSSAKYGQPCRGAHRFPDGLR